jgi:hypothetical protein
MSLFLVDDITTLHRDRSPAYNYVHGLSFSGVRISVGILFNLTENFRGFYQSFQANSRTVPQNYFMIALFISFIIY